MQLQVGDSFVVLVDAQIFMGLSQTDQIHLRRDVAIGLSCFKDSVAIVVISEDVVVVVGASAVIVM